MVPQSQPSFPSHFEANMMTPMVDLCNSTKGESFQQAEDSASSVEPPRPRSVSVVSTTSQLSSRNPKDVLRHRIFHLSEMLRVEKANRDDNTSCYVELVGKADREKAPSIRQAFERINQRSSANIAQLEQRLQDSWAQLKKLEQRIFTSQDSSSSSATPAQQQLTTPRNSMSHQPSFSIPRNRTTETCIVEELLPSISESKENRSAQEASSKQILEEEIKQRVQELKAQLLDLREDHKVLEDEWHKLDESWKADKQQMMELLQEEKKRYYHLEVQVNDVIQINLNEITNLKHDLACTEEKMVYQSYERSRDIWEVLDSYQTRLSKLEMQQQAQQQEAMELPQASVYKLYGQLINLLLTIATILLVCVSTISACSLPLLRTRWRALATLLVIVIISAAWKYFPVIREQEWRTWLPSAW
uniref:testis-specific protein TEX28 isoform X1 n=2 Tax=Podarcis muralis TaxID=64176 RepID=UPI00109EE78D|nr:testis-specific protein TEX28 isoform X1 [Podarcis muralis]XP_028567186.1 testis-specific protein TEX28 isoform X1 [Podarcis muralis]XP_028567188.1 testis-specific protein TEX28 isoform X1 [Podarcis muralis]